MNTQLQIAVNFVDAADLDLRNIERIALIKRAVEEAQMTRIKTKSKKVWRTMPDHHYNLVGNVVRETPHQCYSRAEANGM